MPDILPALLTAAGTDADQINYSTASVNPTPGTLVLAAVSQHDLGSARADPTCSGCGLTWTLVNAVGGAGTENALYVFRAFADPGLVTAGAITFTGVVTAGQTADGAQWCVVETPANTTTNNGVVQSAVAGTNLDSVEATLGTFELGGANGTVAFISSYDNAGGALDITPGAGFTMLAGSEVSQASGGDTLRIGFQWRADNDTSVNATVSAANDRLLIVGMEIAAPPVTGTAAGAATGSGTATGTRTVLGTSAGVATGAGTATGTRTVLGTAAGAGTSSGTATGTVEGEEPTPAPEPVRAGGGLQAAGAGQRARIMREDEELILVLAGVD